MFSRTCIALGLALLLCLTTSIAASAKGGFSFITIAGPHLKESVRLTDTALTEDFFTFANFYEDKTKAPANPGESFEITRYYVDGKREILFDRLHYYPESGFVFYNGIENGESEYDDEWYTANPEIKTVFESALSIQTGSAVPAEQKQPITSASQPEDSIAQSKPVASGLPSLPVTRIVIAIALAVISAFAFWRRRHSTQ